MVDAFESTEGSELVQRTYPELKWYAKDLLGPGCYILASKPKLGKTYWCLQLALAIVTEGTFLDRFETRRAGICLLQLEDGLQRAQRRLWDLADEVGSGLRLVEHAERLDTGLLEQIDVDLAAHPGTGVYVIDTFAAVRPPDAEYSYQTDYGHSKRLSDFATERGICIVLVHHCRKAIGFGDAFDDISGTNGLTAGATGMVVLAKDPRDPGRVIMTAKGKDVEEAAYRIEFESHRWHMAEPLSQEEALSYSIPDCITSTIAWMDTIAGKWTGSTTELFASVGIEGVSLGAYGKYLAQHRAYMLKAGVSYQRRHTRAGTMLTLMRVERRVETDG